MLTVLFPSLLCGSARGGLSVARPVAQDYSGRSLGSQNFLGTRVAVLTGHIWGPSAVIILGSRAFGNEHPLLNGPDGGRRRLQQQRSRRACRLGSDQHHLANTRHQLLLLLGLPFQLSAPGNASSCVHPVPSCEIAFCHCPLVSFFQRNYPLDRPTMGRPRRGHRGQNRNCRISSEIAHGKTQRAAFPLPSRVFSRAPQRPG